MRRPSNRPDLEELIAVCLELYEAEGPRAVDALLGDHPDSAHLVRERLDVLGRLGLVGEPPADSQPERIGSYEVLGTLGRGGMGVVYEALQDTPRRHVALKVLRTMPGESARGRFQHEAELLARLQHPGIAQVYEVGAATVGGMTVPFFAMELVRGAAIDEYAESAGLGLRERLALLASVADAVHHAHQKGIVHRDLKPANVLVDERGQPRVLDFGIARVIDPDLRVETLRTEVGQLVGTLAYMSPEQAAGDPAEIDSRTDVYSLGVLAHELLLGRLPHAVAGRPVLEVLQTIRDDPIPPLSDTDRGLRGDVETIVATALEKEKERRYSSAHEFAADLRRFLDDQPITARPATATYQLFKFTRRHRALVGGALAFVLALALGLAGTLTGMVRAANERDDAERRFEQADSVLAFLKRMFASADPLQEGVFVEDLLDRAVLLVESESGDPLEEASLTLMLGDAYEGLGLYEKADPLIAAAAAAYERELGLEDLQTLSARVRLAALYGHPMMRIDDAERALDGIPETASRVHGPTHDVTLSARLVRATLEHKRGRNAESLRIAREVLELVGPERAQWVSAKKRLSKSLRVLGEIDEAIEIAREVHAWSLEKYGRDHPATWSAMDTLGNLLLGHGRLAEGTAIVNELLALRKEHLGPSHPDTLNAMTNAGVGYWQRGEFAQAEELLLEALDGIEARYPPGHPERLFTLDTLASVYVLQERAAEAEPILAEVVERSREIKGAEHHDTLTTMANHARALLDLRRFKEAEALYLETLEILRRVDGGGEDTLFLLHNLGKFYLVTARHEEADVYIREAVEKGRATLGPDHFAVGTFLRGFGANLIYLGRYEEAEAALFESTEWMERTLPDYEGHHAYLTLLRQFVKLYTRWGKPEEAAMYTAILEERDS